MQPLNIPGIANGYRVDDVLWRGAQPDDSAWPLLAAAGCRAVVDLSNTGELANHQLQLVTAAKIVYWGRPWDGFVPPSQSAVSEVLSVIDASYRYGLSPVLVHCLHGSDRTGTLCAIWRMHHDGWEFDDAMKEAFTSLGMQGMHEFWMAAAVAQFAHERKEAVRP